jgi:NAD(P) transhydrogenase
MTPERYDLIVLGSGPAGEKGAAQAAYFGKKVALIEKAPHLGGAATNTGTIPSKTLRESALFLSGFRQRDLFGLHFRIKDKVTVADFLAREHHIKDKERTRIDANLERHKVKLYVGTGSFIDANTIAIKPERCPEFQIQGDVILIATGSYPFRPPQFRFYDPRIYDSDTILSVREIPPSMLVIGGGVIGCEYACMFAELGVKVTIVEKRPSLIGFLDDELAQALQAQMAGTLGVTFHMSDEVADLQCGETIEARLKSEELASADVVLVSSGRCGNVDGLGLDKVGIAASERGQIKVNEHFHTGIGKIYAAGDVIGFPSLASTSMEQARVAIVHAFDLKYKETVSPILPFGVYTIPECSMAGQTEEQLQKDKVPYVVGRARYSDNARGQIIGDNQGLLKLIFHEETMKLLGVHMIGELATELIHVGLTALLLRQGADLFINTCFNYPTLTEMYKYATYDALGCRARRKSGVTV